jgi:WD40 repeat protein
MQVPYPELPTNTAYPVARKVRRWPLILALLIPITLLGGFVALVIIVPGLISAKIKELRTGDKDKLEIVQQSSISKEVCSIAVAEDGSTWAYGCEGLGTKAGVWFFSEERNGWMIVGALKPEEFLFDVRERYDTEHGLPRNQLQNLREGAEALQYSKSRDAFVWASGHSGRVIASQTKQTTYTRNGEPVTESRKYEAGMVLYQFDQEPTCLAVSPNGSLIAVGLQVWPRYPEDENFATTQPNEHLVLLKWDGVTATLARSLSGMKYSVRACTFSADGSLLVTGGNDSRIRIWDPHDGKLLDEVEVEAPVTQVSVTADATRILYCTERGHVVMRARDGAVIREFHESVADLPRGSTRSLRWTAAAFSPDGSRFAYDCDELVVGETATCETLAKRHLERGMVRQVVWSADGKRLAVGYREAVYLLDVNVPK